MNDLLVLESGNGAVTNIKKALSRLTEHHKKVSEIKTPKPFVKQKMGMDYVEYSYMREVADKEYPGWSWTVIKTEFAGTEAYVVHGRLNGLIMVYGEKVILQLLIEYKRNVVVMIM